MERKWNKLLREKVNSTDYIRAKYENHNGKDEFSVICSAMDWLDVGMTNMDRALMELRHSDRLVRCMKFYQYIWCIDIVWECICQLQRVFINKELPLKGDSSVFNRKYYDKDDNAYFKEIRACFGAHAVKLDKDENGDRKFASWSGSIDNQEFSVSIYSNNPNAKYMEVSVTISELQFFIEKRCRYIQTFLDFIDKEIKSYYVYYPPIKESSMITYESESPLFESSAPMIVPMLIWLEDGDLRIEAYDGVREVAEEFERRFARYPFSKAALDWLDEQLVPYCNRHGYYRETQGKYRWYRQFTYTYEENDELIQPSTFRWEGDPNLSGLLLDLDPDWLTYVTVVDGVIVSAARVNEYAPDKSSPEITVETALEYRGNGYGVSNVLALARALAEDGERAQYVCSRYNRGSAKLAEKAGFAETGRFYAYTAYRD